MLCFSKSKRCHCQQLAQYLHGPAAAVKTTQSILLAGSELH